MGIALAFAGAPDEAAVQGMYKGTWRAGNETGTVQARVVALGNREYMVLAEWPEEDGKVGKSELKGKLEGDETTFQEKGGETWQATYKDGKITARNADGETVELERFVPKSPTFDKKPPAGATILIDGKNFDNMGIRPPRKGKQPGEWKTFEDEAAVMIPKGGMRSKVPVEGSYDLHVEFMTPLRADKRSQGRGNSGCYLACGTEIQVLDSFGMSTYTGGGCGGLYKWKDPDTFDAEKKYNTSSYPPGVWQTYDVEYRVKTENGKKVGTLTCTHNGVKIHDNVRLKRGPRKGTFHFQDHGNPVKYRNIWFVPVEE
jgi:hypothetical protein